MATNPKLPDFPQIPPRRPENEHPKVLKDVKPATGLFPDYIGYACLERARALYGPLLDD